MADRDQTREMTSRERVRAALARREPDRVPVNYAANAGIDGRLKAHFGLAPDNGEGLLRALGVDFRKIHAPYRGPRRHAEIAGRRVDPQWGVRTRWVEHGSGGYWDFCDFPLRDADDETLRRWPGPAPDDYDYGQIAAQCRRHENLALYVGDPGTADIINRTGMLLGMERTLMDLATENTATLAFIDRRLDLQLESLRREIEAADGRADFLWIGEDLGTQQGPMISLELYRRVLRPRHRRFVELGRKYGLPVMLHSCGSSSWAYEDFIELGVAAVDTLQPEAKDMAPAYLKERFGGRLAFHGCISTAGALTFGSVADVEREVRETLVVMRPGGGYCLSPTHCIQDNSPTENVVALYDAARKYGEYTVDS